jgi:ribosomal protein L3 glutamine methyltransferase
MMIDDESRSALRTLRDWVRWGASGARRAGLHFGHGTDNALDEVAALMLYAVDLAPGIPERYWDTRLTPREVERFAALLARRIDERLPLPYLVGEAWFCGLPFTVDERVLIPRSPIAELIESGFAPWLDADAVTRVLDLGTGSGCIAIACALAFPQATVDAVDIDGGALAVAAVNRERHRLGARLALWEGDLYAPLPAARRFDLIVSNPPYVDAEDMAALPAEFRHEPTRALAAGDDGLDLVRGILAGAAARLTADGVLVVEVGNSAEAVCATWPGLPLHWLEFERGGEGVFLITAEQLRDHWRAEEG